MTSLKQRLIAAGVGASMLAASVAAIDGTSEDITRDEGRHLVAYYDSLGIVTACEGVVIPGVKAGDVFTDEECDELKDQKMVEAAAIVDKGAPGGMPLSVRKAFIRFTYNVGPGKTGRKDGFLRLKSGRVPGHLKKINAGNFRGACEQLLEWANAGGKPCAKTKGQKNGCYGVFLRRESERKMCLSGL